MARREDDPRTTCRAITSTSYRRSIASNNHQHPLGGFTQLMTLALT